MGVVVDVGIYLGVVVEDAHFWLDEVDDVLEDSVWVFDWAEVDDLVVVGDMESLLREVVVVVGGELGPVGFAEDEAGVVLFLVVDTLDEVLVLDRLLVGEFFFREVDDDGFEVVLQDVVGVVVNREELEGLLLDLVHLGVDDGQEEKRKQHQIINKMSQADDSPMKRSSRQQVSKTSLLMRNAGSPAKKGRGNPSRFRVQGNDDEETRQLNQTLTKRFSMRESVGVSQSSKKSHTFLEQLRYLTVEKWQSFFKKRHTNKSQPGSLSKKDMHTQVYFQYVVMPILMLNNTTLCIVSLFLWNIHNTQHYLPHGSLLTFDLAIAALLLTEYLSSLLIAHTLIREVVRLEKIADLLIIIQIFYEYFTANDTGLFIFFSILRSLRILKLRYLINLVFTNLKKFLFKTQNDEVSAEPDHDHNELNKFILDSLIKFSSGIFIESTYFLAFDRYVDYQGYHPFQSTSQKMNYLTAIYFAIVSFSTLGYGDMYPIHPLTRFSQAVILIVNITVMSNFLGKLIEFLFQLSPFDREYQFSEHIVIIGELNDDKLKDFMDELVENDKAQNELNYQNQFKQGMKTLIVRDEDPADTMNRLSLYYTEHFGNETTFLKADIFSENKRWYSQSNLKEAKFLLAFSSSTEMDNYENDKLICLIASGIKEAYCNLRIMVVLRTTFKEQFKSDSLSGDIEVVCPYQLNNQILATTLVNSGFSTVVQHLIKMKQKTVSEELLRAVQGDVFLLSYVADMQQEIYQFTAPKFFIGMEFKDVVHMLYLYGLQLTANEVLQEQFTQNHIKDDRKMTLIAVESKSHQVLENVISEDDEENDDDRSRYDQIRKSRQKLEEQLNQFIQPSRAETLDHRTILFNPQNYRIQQGDQLYVICADYEIAMEALKIDRKDCPFYLRYANNALTLAKNIQQKRERQKQIISMFRKKTETRNHQSNPKIIDLKANQPVPQQFANHFVIFANLQCLTDILPILRKYTNKTILLYSDELLDESQWQAIQENYHQVYYVRGDYLNHFHLLHINLQHAFRILITTKLINSKSFPDAGGISIARILLDYFERDDFLIQLQDETRISFLNKNSKLKSLNCPYQLYPSFVAGNVHFSSTITAILAKAVYSPNWLKFFQGLTIPTSKLNQNNNISYVKITKEISSNFQFYGQIFYQLIEFKPSIIPIGLIKNIFQSKFHELLIEQLLDQDFIKQLEKIFEDIDSLQKNTKDTPEIIQNGLNTNHQKLNKLKKQVELVLSKIIGSRFVLTNPSFYTVIEENDNLIVLGDLNMLKKKIKNSCDSFMDYEQFIQNDDISKLKDIFKIKKVKERIDQKKKVIEEMNYKLESRNLFHNLYGNLMN